jgi:two-component system chemotaxis response regulator CheB
MKAPIRVLIVDDSAFARKVLREVLGATPGVEVVGYARDGLEALEKVAELKPDVMTLDLVMPNLDGIGVLKNLPPDSPPRVLVVSISDASSELAVQALDCGAVDLVRKPTALATDQLYELGRELVEKVKVAALVRRSVTVPPITVAPLEVPLVATRKIVVIGTSTGGPQALARLLPCLPQNLPVPVAIALHIPAGYTGALAARLNERCALQVAEAEPDLVLRPGLAILARGGEHLAFRRSGEEVRAHLASDVERLPHIPSVDVLFQSAVAQFGSGVLGVVLTGMGDDGCRGARAIREAGGCVLTEAESSCVVYGMPRSVVEAGYSSEQAPLERMHELILAHL